MKNEPNIEQIVQPHSTAHLTIAKLMENLKFSQMTFPIFPHFANDEELGNLESSSHLQTDLTQSAVPSIQKHPESFFLTAYFWIILCSGNWNHFPINKIIIITDIFNIFLIKHQP